MIILENWFKFKYSKILGCIMYSPTTHICWNGQKIQKFFRNTLAYLVPESSDSVESEGRHMKQLDKVLYFVDGPTRFLLIWALKLLKTVFVRVKMRKTQIISRPFRKQASILQKYLPVENLCWYIDIDKIYKRYSFLLLTSSFRTFPKMCL